MTLFLLLLVVWWVLHRMTRAFQVCRQAREIIRDLP